MKGLQKVTWRQGQGTKEGTFEAPWLREAGAENGLRQKSMILDLYRSLPLSGSPPVGVFGRG